MTGSGKTDRWTRIVQRKLGRSFEKRGLGGTLVRCVTQPVGRGLAAFSGVSRRARMAEEAFDRRHGVDTHSDRGTAWIADPDSPNWRHGEGYEPVADDLVPELIGRLGIDPRNYTFIDYGAGKGKALLEASHFPFQSVIGVEYAPRLHEIAERNLAVYRSPDRQCDEVTAVCCDASEFEPPPAPTVAFFHHPFDARVFDTVLDRIDHSLAVEPRPLFALYVDPRCGDRFLARGYREMARDRDRWAIYLAPGTECPS